MAHRYRIKAIGDYGHSLLYEYEYKTKKEALDLIKRAEYKGGKYQVVKRPKKKRG
jgi:hypothetical protein